MSAEPVRDTAGPGDAGSAREAALVPWEDPAVGFPVGFFRTWGESLMEPEAFFRRVDYAGAFLRPLLYFLLVVIAWASLALAWQLLFPSPLPGFEPDPRGALFSFFFTPFLALAGLVVGTLMVHVTLALAGAARGLDATARVLCYASGPALFAFVPLAGQLAAAAWGFVIQVVGLREAHGVRTGVAVVAALIPPLVAAVLLLIAVFTLLQLGEGLSTLAPWLRAP